MIEIKAGGIHYSDFFGRHQRRHPSADPDRSALAARAAHNLRPVPWGDWELIEKRYASPKTHSAVKVPLGGDDEPLKAYRVGLKAYAEKRRHPDSSKVAWTYVYYYPDFYLSALPDKYIVAFYVQSLRSDGRWKRLNFTRAGIPFVRGGQDYVGRLAFLDTRTTHSRASITRVQIYHRVMVLSYLQNAPLLQINTTLTNELRRVSDKFKKPSL